MVVVFAKPLDQHRLERQDEDHHDYGEQPPGKEKLSSGWSKSRASQSSRQRSQKSTTGPTVTLTRSPSKASWRRIRRPRPATCCWYHRPVAGKPIWPAGSGYRHAAEVTQGSTSPSVALLASNFLDQFLFSFRLAIGSSGRVQR